MVSDQAVAAARMVAGAGGAGMFMASSAGSSRYATGSHIDVRDIQFALGVAKSLQLPGLAALTLGGFFEHGQGRYDSYNDFGADGQVHGRGDSQYSGAGVLLHVAGLGAAASQLNAQQGLYLNAALRAGRSKNTFDSADMVDASGVQGRYTSRARYFSAMAGAGYVLQLDSKQSLDLYGRYTWGRLGADTVQIGNSSLEFGASKSSRLRLGARYRQLRSKDWTPYVGLALEREFKGNASGQAYGLAIEQPSLKGNTGIVEAGVSMKPWQSLQALSLDMGLQAYFGKREGLSGSVKLKYAF